MNEGWNHEELSESVKAYMEMLQKTRSGKNVIKKGYYRELSKRFGRTEKAYEFRMQNISYVLSLMGRDWLAGLRPARNVGVNIAEEIEKIIAEIEGKKPGLIAGFETQVQIDLAKGSLPSKPSGVKNPATYSQVTSAFERDPKVKAWVLIAAQGRCECCGSDAPFLSADGLPFLEVHHVRRLADGGSDSVENTVAVCPNCHRELHHGVRSKELVEQLYTVISRLRRE